MYKWLVYLVILMMFYGTVEGKTEEKETIKFGTLATEASDWGKTFQQMNAELMEKSDGQLQFQFYFGKDDKDLIDLLRNKRLDVVSVSVPALGQVLPEVFVLLMPKLFATYEELDHARNALTPYFSEQFVKKGYILLGWADTGLIYLFSKEPIKTQTDLQKTQLWVWDIDPVAKAFASASGREPILLPVQSVLPSLMRGDIQTVYAPPLACIAYQWHTQVKYMSNFTLAAGVGGTIIDKNRFDKFSEKHKRLLRAVTKEYHEQLIAKIRKRNEESIGVLQEQGIIVIEVPQQEKLKWLQIAGRVQNQFAGQLYKQELLDEIKNLLEEYRRIGE